MEKQDPSFNVSRKTNKNWSTMIALDKVGDQLDPSVLYSFSLIPFAVAGAVNGDKGPGSAKWFCQLGFGTEKKFHTVDELKAYLKVVDKTIPYVREQEMPGVSSGNLINFVSDEELEKAIHRKCFHIAKSIQCSKSLNSIADASR
ncbi:hypothetical protein CYMTET_30524 [Cymbomonas tetramitiformis]|uniref:Uncharacterized protein n=1 Tax=Cymbomonas tetramitiformis TaxID=36881 RepID=A0AAE0FJA2_9CHLO|nr:hypothetical protein CYMTET_30524 [Cymbomonas tetramitiformis]